MASIAVTAMISTPPNAYAAMGIPALEEYIGQALLGECPDRITYRKAIKGEVVILESLLKPWFISVSSVSNILHYV